MVMDSGRQGHRGGNSSWFSWEGIKKGAKAGWDWAGSQAADTLADIGSSIASVAGHDDAAASIQKFKEVNAKARDIKERVGRAQDIINRGPGARTSSGKGAAAGGGGLVTTVKRINSAVMGMANPNPANPASNSAVNQGTGAIGAGPANGRISANRPMAQGTDMNAMRQMKRQKM